MPRSFGLLRMHSVCLPCSRTMCDPPPGRTCVRVSYSDRNLGTAWTHSEANRKASHTPTNASRMHICLVTSHLDALYAAQALPKAPLKRLCAASRLQGSARQARRAASQQAAAQQLQCHVLQAGGQAGRSGAYLNRCALRTGCWPMPHAGPTQALVQSQHRCLGCTAAHATTQRARCFLPSLSSRS